MSCTLCACVYVCTSWVPYQLRSAWTSHFSSSSISRAWTNGPALQTCFVSGWEVCVCREPANRSASPRAAPPPPLQDNTTVGNKPQNSEECRYGFFHTIKLMMIDIELTQISDFPMLSNSKIQTPISINADTRYYKIYKQDIAAILCCLAGWIDINTFNNFQPLDQNMCR